MLNRVREHLQTLPQVGRCDRGKEVGGVAGRAGIEGRADVLEGGIDLALLSRRSAFEDDVLKEVRGPVLVRLLVAGTRADPEVDGDEWSVMLLPHENSEPVVEREQFCARQRRVEAPESEDKEHQDRRPHDLPTPGLAKPHLRQYSLCGYR